MSDFSWGVVAGTTSLLLGFTIGWNAAFYVMWRHHQQLIAEKKRALKNENAY